MINKICVFIVGLFILSPFAFAETVSCPSTKAIKAISFSDIKKGDTSGVWVLDLVDQFKTPYKWQFSLMLEAENKNDALKKAKKGLAKLTKLRGPEKSDSVWVCDYKAPGIMSAVASTFPK